MASFKALNIESDDELDDEPDNTKEIQIEEALKIYQNALKYHSQGSRSLKKADEAYKSLFESEIFQYPESQSEYTREENIAAHQQLNGDADIEVEFVQAAPATNGENASSALPQILHLSYKNRGQHQLETIAEDAESELATESGEHDARSRIRNAAIKALDDFGEALDKDEDDLDLWRRAAQVGETLCSSRIARFCLEGVLDEDENNTDDILGARGIETSLGREEWEKVTTNINDDLSLLQAPALDGTAHVPSAWMQQLDPYPRLPTVPASSLDTSVNKNVEIQVSDPTWNGVGQAILQQLRRVEDGTLVLRPGALVQLRLLSEPAKPQTTQVTNDMDVDAHIFELPNGTSDVHAPETDATLGKDEESAPLMDPVLPSTVESSANDVAVASVAEVTNGTAETSTGQPEANGSTPSSRKRSVEVAELSTGPEGGRGRSKRIRARFSVGDESLVDGRPDVMTDYDWNVRESTNWDNLLFDILRDIASKCGMPQPAHSQSLRNSVLALSSDALESPVDDIPLRLAFIDLYTTMQKWTDNDAKILLQDNDPDQSSAETEKTGLLTFLEHSSSRNPSNASENITLDLQQWVDEANLIHGSVQEVAMSFIFALMGTWADGISTWSSELKQTIVQFLMSMHDYILERLPHVLEPKIPAERATHSASLNLSKPQTLNVVENIFELHLDVYTRFANPTSEVDSTTKIEEKARLDSWCDIARQGMIDYLEPADGEKSSTAGDKLILRHLWTSAFYLGACEDVDREHLILCIESLRTEIESRGNMVIELPNNGVLPEISIAAADREVSKLKTMDFFLGVFKTEGKAAVDLIEDLEPLLESTVSKKINRNNGLGDEQQQQLAGSPSDEESTPGEESGGRYDTRRVLSEFLHLADPALRLMLWRRLREAYEQIDYPTKVFSLCLQSVQLLMEELKSTTYSNKKLEERVPLLLDYIRECGFLVKKALDLTGSSTDVFDCIEEDGLRSYGSALLDLWTLLYAVGLWDDYSQAGGKGGSNVNPFRFYPIENFHGASVKLHDMQVQVCILLYKLYMECAKQMPERIPHPVEDQLQLLRHMHFSFGVRRLCKAYDSMFLRFSMDELMRLPEMSRQSSDDLAQVLYDLYDLYCFSTPHERLEHGCDEDYLDRKTALQLMDFVMDKARKMNMKDLLKSELGKTIEKLHGALGSTKSNTAVTARNKKIILAYIRSAIRPLDLVSCLEGIGELSAVSLQSEDEMIASKGWFFLKGEIALARFRAQRTKASQASEDDLNVAISFFQDDLQYNPEHWQSWYLLGQAHDALVDEHVLWSADKVNNHQDDLTVNQRVAIHAYALAVAGALRSSEKSETRDAALADLYYCFGNRIYASSRQPFYLRAFSLRDFPDRYYFDATVEGGRYPGRSFKGLRSINAWRLAATMLKRSAALRPSHWLTHYMLAKCLWKIRTHIPNCVDPRFSVDAILLALSKAVKNLPVRKDPTRQDPVLEPIYKTVSTAHKMVERGDIDNARAAKVIEECLVEQDQFDVTRIPSLTDFDDWSGYMIEILRILRAADKSRWHHRLVMRAAHIMHAAGDTPKAGVKRAKEYLIDQHMFSIKTLALTVWKPEHERPGRHWFYMKKYAIYLGELLDLTDDCEAMEILTRRIRKKANEYYEHTSLWEELCNLHVQLHRRYANVPLNITETVFRNVDQEEFAARATLIDAWTASNTPQHPLQEVLREIAELKKLNGGLIKSPTIDDLLGDTYAAIWTEIGPSLEQQTRPKPPVTPAQFTLPPELPVPPTPPLAGAHSPDRRSVMSLTNLMNIDGVADVRTTSMPVTPTNPAFPALTPALLPPAATPSGPAPVRSRPRLISRREILKRASDTVNLKTVAPRNISPPARTISPSQIPTTIPKVVINVKARSVSPGVAADTSIVSTPVEVDDGEGDGMKPGAQGSLANGDDGEESELSELEAADGDDEDEDDEDEQTIVVTRPSMFPNLRRDRIRGGDEDGDDTTRDVTPEPGVAGVVNGKADGEDEDDPDDDVDMAEEIGDGVTSKDAGLARLQATSGMSGERDQRQEDVDMKGDGEHDQAEAGGVTETT